MLTMLRTFLSVLSSIVVMALMHGPVAHAATTIRVWHTLQGPHQVEFEALIAQFNRESSGVTVALRAFDHAAALRAALARQTRSQTQTQTQTRPHLVQLPDDHTPEVVAEAAQMLPLYQLLAAHPIADAAWFLPQTSQFVHDARGRLLAFPYMAEVPVMFTNQAAYERAGLAGEGSRASARTWADLQAELIDLRAGGTLCPLLTSQQVPVHFENLAAVNGKPYLQAGKAVKFDTLFMRHVSLMSSWKRAALLTHHSPDHEASVRFAQGDCGVLMAGSGALAELRQNPGLRVGVASLPYYAQESTNAVAPLVSGAALWALAGHSSQDVAATAAFLAWLAKPVTAARWHQRTGFLPLTHAAFRAAQVSFYPGLPGAQSLIAALRQTPATSRGFRLPDYPAMEAVLNQSFEAVMAGEKPPVQVLNDARARIRAIK